MSRRLIAALACRAGGARLYGKPLQNLEPGHTILDNIIGATKSARPIDGIVLGISEGTENLVFSEVARRHQVGCIFGDQKDVLSRLIQCGEAGAGTDVFRVTTECPFTAWELLDEAWSRHLAEGNDITVCDYLPEGCHFEIYTLAALRRSHTEGEDRERSEFCSAYPRRCPDRFRIGLVEPEAAARRLDLRLTVDYPEDLVVCREAYGALKHLGPHIPIARLAEFLDGNPALTGLLTPYIDQTPYWAHTVRK